MRFIAKEDGKHVAEVGGETLRLTPDELKAYGYEEGPHGYPVKVAQKPVAKVIKGPKDAGKE